MSKLNDLLASLKNDVFRSVGEAKAFVHEHAFYAELVARIDALENEVKVLVERLSTPETPIPSATPPVEVPLAIPEVPPAPSVAQTDVSATPEASEAPEPAQEPGEESHSAWDALKPTG